MTGDDDDTMTWHDREVVTALRRLASARSRLDQLQSAQPDGAGPTVSAADLAILTELHEDIERLAAKAKSRFGGGNARERRAELQAKERMVLQRLGVADYAEAREAARPARPQEVDPEVLAFAERELAAAEEAWREVQALEVPEEPEVETFAAEGGADLDLRLDPPAAS